MPAPAPADQDDAVYIIVRNGVVTFVGSNTSDVSGYAPSHFEGRHVLDLIHPDDHSQLEEALRPGWTGKFNKYVRVQDADGAWTWRAISGVRTIDASGQPRTVAELRKVDTPE
jgi:PAS domain S-box-containing protein